MLAVASFLQVLLTTREIIHIQVDEDTLNLCRMMKGKLGKAERPQVHSGTSLHLPLSSPDNTHILNLNVI